MRNHPKTTSLLFGCFVVAALGSVCARADDKDRAVLERIDGIYASIPALNYKPPVDRWGWLPKTMKRLGEGAVLRVVMLGDSIVNDTSRSAWEELVERHYPKCKIEKVTSVRGSTGCWWYKEEDRVKTWVLDHKPDLVMIGGISNRGDVESIREVIRQIRAGSDAEILVTTGPFGHYDPRKDEHFTAEIDPDGESYESRLKRMAAEEQVEFVDVQGPWAQYIRTCGRDLDEFKRDAVHANAKGEAVLGRILERYFRPK